MVAVRYEISLHVFNSKRNSISARAHILFSIEKASKPTLKHFFCKYLSQSDTYQLESA